MSHILNHPRVVGFVNRTDSSLSFASNTLTLTKVANFTVFLDSHPAVFTANQTVAIPNATGFYYCYLSTAGVLSQSTSMWDIAGTAAPVATVYFNATNPTEALVFDERHSYLRNPIAHEIQHFSIGPFWESGLVCSFGSADGSISVTPGRYHDEDLEHELTANPTTTARIVYRDGSGWRIDAANADIRKTSGGNLCYDNTGITAVSANEYCAYWVYITNVAGTPEIHVLVGQAKDTSLANVQAYVPDSLTLPPWLSSEGRLLYKVIYRRDGTSAAGHYISLTDYRAVKSVGGTTLASTYIPTGGGTMTGDLALNGAGISFQGNISASAWTTNGLRLKGIAGTLTDTTSSGTVATAATNKLGGNTIAASSSTTFTDYATLYLDAPTAGCRAA